MAKIKVIIPAFNEENAVGKVVAAIPKSLVEEIIVVDNNSSDNTRIAAEQAGATVLSQPNQGYGWACLKGLDYIKADPPEIVVFLDADFSDYPEEMPQVLAPILRGEAEMVIGSRALGTKERKSMTPQQIFGNWLATKLIKLFYGVNFTDLGPFRAITWAALELINMQDKTYGWTVEMQVKAAKLKIPSVEVPVNYKERIGVSKVSGTIKGTILAGYKILFTIFKYI